VDSRGGHFSIHFPLALFPLPNTLLLLPKMVKAGKEKGIN